MGWTLPLSTSWKQVAPRGAAMKNVAGPFVTIFWVVVSEGFQQIILGLQLLISFFFQNIPEMILLKEEEWPRLAFRWEYFDGRLSFEKKIWKEWSFSTKIH